MGSYWVVFESLSISSISSIKIFSPHSCVFFHFHACGPMLATKSPHRKGCDNQCIMAVPFICEFFLRSCYLTFPTGWFDIFLRKCEQNDFEKWNFCAFEQLRIFLLIFHFVQANQVASLLLCFRHLYTANIFALYYFWSMLSKSYFWGGGVETNAFISWCPRVESTQLGANLKHFSQHLEPSPPNIVAGSTRIFW